MVRLERQTKALYEMCAVALVRGSATLDGADEVGFKIDMPIFTVSHVANLTDTHPQTLRQYDRLRLIMPQRTEGGARRYSLRDIDRLVQTQKLSQEDGVNLAGIMRILALQEENRQLKRQIRHLIEEANCAERNIFTATVDGNIVEVQRSQSAKDWRRDIRVQQRALPSSYNKHSHSQNDAQYNNCDYDDLNDDKSVVLWRAFRI
ncbi:heat shock protein transcriptional repressor HspR [Gardnerella vaginalis]|uniref:heat shock protein transcriptional repressor HspR n=1 Tax=Gardnerella vaginalis TaxID=2702 RepID=UPI0039F0E1DB